MLQVTKHGVILTSSGAGFELDGILNPGVWQDGEHVHMFYRAVAKGNYSTLGYARFNGPHQRIEKSEKPVLFPQYDYESQGIEDPRVVKIDDIFYLSYTAYDGVNAIGALATSTDLINFNKLGIICPRIMYNEFKRLAECKNPLNEKYIRYNKRESITQKHNKPVFMWIKNLVFFPRRIDGDLVFMLRIKPDIQLARVKQLDELNNTFWEDYFQNIESHILMTPKFDHEVSYIGAGCPPIETSKGWVIIYHGVHDSPQGYVYCACAALLDLKNPCKEIARLPYALFRPEHAYELLGEVNNVCFPTGTSLFGDILHIYYGAADDMIACASVSMNELLLELSNYPTTYEPLPIA